MQHVFRLHGFHRDIVLDRGPQFTSQMWKTFCSALGVKVSLSSGYHPPSNGQTERMNQTLENTLRWWRCGIPLRGAHTSLGWSMP